jgi:hypothetical protein
MKLSFLGVLIIGFLTIGCGPKLIPGLDIELADTPDHRALLKVLDSYRQAFENKDVKSLLSLTSQKFYENSGTSDTGDDYDHQGLNKHFEEHFKKIKNCSLNLQIKDISVEENKATIDYRYVSRYLMDLPSGEKWQIANDLNRMELVKEDDSWKIMSGI